jgi:hypothetical protein
MGRLRGRIKKALDAAAGDKSTLVCPRCGEEFTVFSDAPIEYLCWSWEQDYEGETYRKTPADVLRLTRHPHDASEFVDKETGEPFLGEFLGSLVQIHRSDVPDLSE